MTPYESQKWRVNDFAKNYLDTHALGSLVNLINKLRREGMNKFCMLLCEHAIERYPTFVPIFDTLAFLNYHSGNSERAYDVYDRLLEMKGIDISTVNTSLFNQHFSINHIEDRYIDYDSSLVQEITNRKPSNMPLVTFTITSCKRFDLFQKTINSFIKCCTDSHLIGRWICIDDNSSEEDRNDMKKLYPFIEFYFKEPSEKGHPQSMNIIRSLVKTPYLFHMEDDWKFIAKHPYISMCLDVLMHKPSVKQCLINKNYAEVESDVSIMGGKRDTAPGGTRYYHHQWVRNAQDEEEWKKMHGSASRHCHYWPHFSFRPSLVDSSIFQELGEFNTIVNHFEMDYSYKYANSGYTSAFLEGIYSLHTGRLTSERNDPTKDNAYTLNDEKQFSGKDPSCNESKNQKPSKSSPTLDKFNLDLKTFVINLERRPDRWAKFTENAKEAEFLHYEKYSAVDGLLLKSTPQLQRIFDNNDYNMRMGMVGCAMSHIDLYIKLIQSDADAYCILEDDVEFVPDFGTKLLKVINEASIIGFDLLYLGHHLFTHHITDDVYNKEKMPRIEKWSRQQSRSKSMGGTGGYVITKRGAVKLLDFINKYGMTNGIDTMQQNSADDLCVCYSYPHLIYSECFRDTGSNVDTDIQTQYDSLTVKLEERIDDEKNFHGSLIKICDYETAKNILSDNNEVDNYYFEGSPQEISLLSDICVHPHYTLESTVLVIVPKGGSRYFHRFKKNDEYDVRDALIQKNQPDIL